MITLEVSSSSLSGAAAAEQQQKQQRRLTLCLLGCETSPPYGPIPHTAQLFADLLLAAANKYTSNDYVITIHAYNALQEEYPKDWDLYDGILLPGSFSAAYDDQPWIRTLQDVIRQVIVAHERPTLGICFGHQLLAHTLCQGQAIRNPAGARGGCVPVRLSLAGRQWLLPREDDNDAAALLQLYVTHGDMVSTLPACAVALTDADADDLPYQALAYVGTNNDDNARPFAFTFQAHPEYAVTRTLGVEGTLIPCMDAQLARGAIDATTHAAHTRSARAAYDTVHDDSMRTVAMVGRQLGWWE